MVLTKQLGEEDTDEIAQLLQEWDADKVTHPIAIHLIYIYICYIYFTNTNIIN